MALKVPSNFAEFAAGTLLIPNSNGFLAFVTGKYIIDCAMLVCHPASFSSIYNQVTNPILLAVLKANCDLHRWLKWLLIGLS